MGEPGRVKNQEKGPREKVAASSWPSRTVTWCTLKRVPPSQGKARAQGPRDPPPGARASNPRPEKEDLKEQGLLSQRRERGPQGAGPPTPKERKRTPGSRASNPRPEKEDPREQGFQPQTRERGPQGAGLPTLDQRKRISGSRASYPRGEKEDLREQGFTHPREQDFTHP